MYKLCVYVPEDALEQVKQALFAAGAGRLGDYSDCCWQVLGTGQFRPGVSSDPAIGSVGATTRLQEYRVEMLCPEECVELVIEALREAHPYEEPAFDLMSVRIR
ncbi:MAG: YqfO family protein [Pseudomonadota bacterium]